MSIQIIKKEVTEIVHLVSVGFKIKDLEKITDSLYKTDPSDPLLLEINSIIKDAKEQIKNDNSFSENEYIKSNNPNCATGECD
tara:strand:- start:12712 stop:12960 length:249 start_codon:yes stop_codon:yes gene_type:complete